MKNLEAAKKKIEGERKTLEGKKLGDKQKAFLPFVADALIGFCEQDDEFAEAVVQGKALSECLNSIAGKAGRYISDLDVCKQAVQFYFEGADVRFAMEIMLSPADEKPEAKPERAKNAIVLDISDFF